MTTLILTALLFLASFTLGFMFGVTNNSNCVQKVRDFLSFWKK
jgi:hypothetical protein